VSEKKKSQGTRKGEERRTICVYYYYYYCLSALKEKRKRKLLKTDTFVNDCTKYFLEGDFFTACVNGHTLSRNDKKLCSKAETVS
jgi:hypothetical protein